jgi:hypothetical protein
LLFRSPNAAALLPSRLNFFGVTMDLKGPSFTVEEFFHGED